MKIKFRTYLLWLSLSYAGLYTILILIDNFTNITLTSFRLVNILILGSFLLPLLPYVWFSYIKPFWLMISVYATYSIFLLVCLFVDMGWLLAVMWIIGDITSGNEFKTVYEYPIEGNKFLVVYKTPDEGALGGGDIRAAIVKKLVPGLIDCKFLSEDAIIFDSNSNTDHVVIDGISYRIPKETILLNCDYVKRSEVVTYDELKIVDRENDVTYLVENDGQTLSAIDKGQELWSVNIIEKCGNPSVGSPYIRDIVKEDHKIVVTYGKHSFASVDVKSGEVTCIGAD